MTRIISATVSHRVQFAPDPQNRSFPTKPQRVETRQISDVAVYPEGVNFVMFHDVVITVIELPSGERQTLVSEPVNDSGEYRVNWGTPTQSEVHTLIPVHPDVEDKLFVTPTSAKQMYVHVAEQATEGRAWDIYAGSD